MRPFVSLPLLAIAAGCSRDTRSVAAVCQDPAWRTSYSADSSVALCLPPRFRAVDPRRRWARGEAADSDFASLSVAVLDSAEAAAEWGAGARPRRLRDAVDTTHLHAISAESVRAEVVRIDGQPVEVEMGRVSGGIGLHRQPVLRAAWELSEGRWALVQGIASDPRDLELLRRMASTVRLSTAKLTRAAT